MSDNWKFSEDGTELIISDPRMPRHWYNYMWNAEYVSFFSQLGQGESLAQDKTGRRIELVKSRQLLIKDIKSGAIWTLNGLPVDNANKSFRCIHGLGYSSIEFTRNEIESKIEIFVPSQGTCEAIKIELVNRSSRRRTMQLFPYVDAGLGGTRKPQSYYNSQGKYCNNTVSLKNHSRFGESETAYVYLASSEKSSGFDCSYDRFIGYGTEYCPDAVVEGKCRSSLGIMEKGILALQMDFSLEAGERKEIVLAIGTAVSEEEIKETAKRFSSSSSFNEIRRRTVEEIGKLLGKTEFRTPDETLNKFASKWLKRQISLGIQWARVRHNGFRDQIQDIGAFADINPDEALRQFKRVVSYQYSNGYAPRTWLDGKILDHDFSDNHVWIPLSLNTIYEVRGESGFLEEPVKFNDGTEATLYEHAKRAVQYLWNDRGHHGLCRIHSGDWNDCMNNVGKGGDGVSVWLSMAFICACKAIKELAEISGKSEDVRAAEKMAEEMSEIIESHAWDGAYYTAAIDNHGNILGSKSNKYGSLYLNSQSWAVLAGLKRGLQGIEAAEKELNTPLGIKCMAKPYDHPMEEIGSMSHKYPEVQENGGVYLHASCFKLAADAILKRHAETEEGLHKLLPFDKTYHDLNCEPYVFCNTYYTSPAYRFGNPGHSWGTGTAGWFYTVLLRYIFGLRPEKNGLRIDPCLPPSWQEAEIKHEFRGASYVVKYNAKNGFRSIASITVNGVRQESSLLPYEKGASYLVELVFKN